MYIHSATYVHVSICQRCKTSASQKPQIGHQIEVTLTQLQLCFFNNYSSVSYFAASTLFKWSAAPNRNSKIISTKYEIWSLLRYNLVIFRQPNVLFLQNYAQHCLGSKYTYVHYVCSLSNLNEAASILMISV